MLEFLNNISESELEGKSRIRKLIYVLHKGLLGIKLSYYEETRIYLYYKFYLPCMNVKNIYRTSYKLIESQDINEIIDFVLFDLLVDLDKEELTFRIDSNEENIMNELLTACIKLKII